MRERERERVCVCVCVRACVRACVCVCVLCVSVCVAKSSLAVGLSETFCCLLGHQIILCVMVFVCSV